MTSRKKEMNTIKKIKKIYSFKFKKQEKGTST